MISQPLKHRGFNPSSTIDNEEPTQPRHTEIEAAAHDAKLAYMYLPIVGDITPEQRHAMQHALATLPTPILAFCRSGARSTRIWAHAMMGQMAVQEILAIATQAGCDGPTLYDELTQQKENSHE